MFHLFASTMLYKKFGTEAKKFSKIGISIERLLANFFDQLLKYYYV